MFEFYNLIQLSNLGRIAQQCWQQIPQHFPHVNVDEFVIMPNHIHGILTIKYHPPMATSVETQNFASLQKLWLYFPNKFGPQSKNLASIIRGFKIGVTNYARQNSIDFRWQSRFYERLIRDEKSLSITRKYIKNNL